jgi:putative transcriptional regulator
MQINMKKKTINRLKAVLAEQNRTNKWLAEVLDKNETTISRWCTNEVQPSVETLVIIASLLKIDVKELINSTKPTTQV